MLGRFMQSATEHPKVILLDMYCISDGRKLAAAACAYLRLFRSSLARRSDDIEWTHTLV